MLTSTNITKILILVWFQILSIHGFKWHLNEVLKYDKYLTFSEMYMFGRGQGPKIMEQGDSYINLDITVYA